MPRDPSSAAIKSLNNELRQAQSTYKMTEQALRNSPSMSYKFAELDALRKVEQNAFNSMQGPGADLLKQRYGALKTLQDVTERRIPVIERANNERLFAGAGKIAGGGNMAMGTIKTVLGKPSEGIPMFAKGAAEWQIGRNIQKMNDPEFLLQSALRNTTPRPAPVIMPEDVTPAPSRPYVPPNRQLPPTGGTTVIPEPPPTPKALTAYPYGQALPPDSRIPMGGKVPEATPPPFHYDTKPMRKGLVLPAHQEAIPLAASPEEPMRVEPAASRVVRDPRTGRMRKIFLTSSREK